MWEKIKIAVYVVLGFAVIIFVSTGGVFTWLQ